MSTDLDLFASAGDGLRPEHFGLTENGNAYVIAGPFAKALGYRDAEKATRLLDDDEKGTQIVGTSERSGRVANRPVSVIFEDGIWELIFRSTLPSAKAIKAKVKAILRQLRETGVVDTRHNEPQLPADYEEALVHLLDKVRENKALAARNAELEAPAAAWHGLVDTGATLDVGSAAKKLRENGVLIGRTRLYTYLREIGWVFVYGTQPKQSAVDAGYVTVDWGKPWTNQKTGDLEQGEAKTRVTPKGMDELLKRLSMPDSGVA